VSFKRLENFMADNSDLKDDVLDHAWVLVLPLFSYLMHRSHGRKVALEKAVIRFVGLATGAWIAEQIIQWFIDAED